MTSLDALHSRVTCGVHTYDAQTQINVLTLSENNSNRTVMRTLTRSSQRSTETPTLVNYDTFHQLCLMMLPFIVSWSSRRKASNSDVEGHVGQHKVRDNNLRLWIWSLRMFRNLGKTKLDTIWSKSGSWLPSESIGVSLPKVSECGLH